MSQQSPQQVSRRRSRVFAAAAAALAVLGVVALVVALMGQQAPPPAPPQAAPESPRSAGTSPTPEDERAGEEESPSEGSSTTQSPSPSPATEDVVKELRYSPATRVRIPRIAVDSSLVDIGLDERGVMETPEPVDRAGWFTPSPPPGVPGATVLAGHVTWDQQPSVFYDLGRLGKGDRITVDRRDGQTATYRVYRTGSFPKQGFPTKQVYTQPPTSELRLITCGGTYDDASNRYLDNVIVWAKIVDVGGSRA